MSRTRLLGADRGRVYPDPGPNERREEHVDEADIELVGALEEFQRAGVVTKAEEFQRAGFEGGCGRCVLIYARHHHIGAEARRGERVLNQHRFA